MSNLPASWIDCQLGDVVNYGITEKVEPSNIAPDAWVLELEDVEKDSSRILNRSTFAERASKSTKNRFEAGDVLLGKLRPYLNKVVRADHSGFCTTEIIPIKPSESVDGSYLFFWLKHPKFLEYVTAVSHGLHMPRLGTDAGRAAPFVLAPINEQKRISDKLDAVLARVDACRERLDRVPAILKRFRQSVLAAATSGRLTEGWRRTHGDMQPSWTTLVNGKPIALPTGYDRLSKQSFKLVPIEHDAGNLPDTWSVTTIAELYRANVLIDFADGNHGSLYPRKEDFGSDGVLFLTATQIGEQWELDLAACPRLKAEKAELLNKGWAQAGDVLLTHNATVGRVAYLENPGEDALLGTSVTFYRFNPRYLEPRFARIVFSSPFFRRQLESVMEQTTRDQVPITKQVSLNFVYPPLAEQQEIIRRVETLFAFADRLQQRHSTALAHIEQLTPALLAKAFRGQLVPQDPNDEPASELLKRIRAADFKSIDSLKSQHRTLKSPRSPKERSAVTKSRFDDDVKGQPYLANLLRQSGRLKTAEELFKQSGLSVVDFYKQLAWEVKQGMIRDDNNILEAQE